nr:hypothetical protein [Tanacetum cinerariifolium]
MSAKRTSWNEFSSSMACAVICLSSGDLSTHTTKYTSPALTQKVFANIRRVGKGFSGVETPLFEGMLVEQHGDEQGDAAEHVEEVNTDDAAEGDDSAAHGEVQTPSPQPQPQQAAGFPMSLLKEAIDACAALTRRVEPLEYDKVAQALEITKLKRKVKKLEKRNKERMIAKMDQDDAVVLKDDKDKEVDDSVKDVEEAKEDETEPAEEEEVVDVVTTAKLITKVVTVASETVTTAPSRRTKGIQRTVHGQLKLKSWKLLESCGVQIITFTTTQLILLVERRYPLSRFTLDQMLNAVRLQVEEKSEVSLELLRFTRQQHQEGQLE